MPVDGIKSCSFTSVHRAGRMLGREQHPTLSQGCREEGMLEQGLGLGTLQGDAAGIAGGCWGQTTQQHPALPLGDRNHEGKRTGEQKSARECRVTVT